MKVKEFVEEIKVTTSIEELLKNIIKKTYIPVMEKKELALATLALSTTNDDGFMQVDEFKKDICFKMLFLKQYTTLEITDDFDSFINEYDVLESADVTEVFFDAYLCEEYKRALCILEQETKNLLSQLSNNQPHVKYADTVNISFVSFRIFLTIFASPRPIP